MKQKRRRSLPRGQLLLLIGMTYGTVIALLLVSAGLVQLVRQGGMPAVAAAAQRGTGQGGHAGHGAQGGTNQAAKDPAPDIRITAEHRGGLLLEVKAEVSMNKDRDPLIRAKGTVTVDMNDMPGSHTKGPLELTATKKPGEYTAAVQLPMPGEYAVKVVLDSPVKGEATKVVPVGLVNPGKPGNPSGASEGR